MYIIIALYETTFPINLLEQYFLSKIYIIPTISHFSFIYVLKSTFRTLVAHRRLFQLEAECIL